MTERVEEAFRYFVDGHAPGTFDEDALALLRVALDEVVPTIYEEAYGAGYVDGYENGHNGAPR